MERMLVVVFENELKAYDGSRALKDLDSEGSISVHAGAVIKKNDNGTVTVKEGGDDFPTGTVGGGAVGALIGLLGGPIGVAVGAAGGALTGAVWDMYRAGVNDDFLNGYRPNLHLVSGQSLQTSARSGSLQSIPEWKPLAELCFALPEKMSKMTSTPEMWPVLKRILLS